MRLLLVALVLVIARDFWLQRPSVKAQGYDRSKYYTRAPRHPFTFLSRYTLTTQTMDHTIRMEVTEAQDGRGRILYLRKHFASSADDGPTIESGRLIEPPDAKATLFYWSKWQQSLGMPLLVSYATDRRLIPEHTFPENNCMAPEPALTFLQKESVMIGGVAYQATVVQSRDNSVTQTTWYATSPGIPCLELKSIANFSSPDNENGTTIHEPVSLSLNEPDPALMDFSSRFASTSIEVVPFNQWETTITSKTKAYEASVTKK